MSVRLLFAGTPQVALPSLDTLAGGPHQVVGVLTRPDSAAGRGRRTAASPVARRAETLGIPVLRPARVGAAETADQIRALAPDCCPVVAYGALLPKSLLGLAEHGWVNLHFSLLPAWRGAAPVQHSLLAGDEIGGATTFRIVEQLDAGPVLGTLTESIRPRDTAGDLLNRLATAGANLLAATIDGLAEGRLQPVPQSVHGVSYAPALRVEDARVRWAEPAFAVDRRVRACTPAPGAWTTLDGHRLKLGPVLPTGPGDHTADPPLAPGELRVTKRTVLVGTATGAVELGVVQPPGRPAMPAADWARGARLAAGQRLGT